MKTRLITVTFSFLFLGGIFSCIKDNQFDGECPYPDLAKLDSINQIFFSPYLNKKYSTKTDTVAFRDFRFHVEFGFEKIQRNNGQTETPRNPVCEPEYDVRDISNIAIILTGNYDGIQIGTDVSYLFLLPDGSSINRFREFSRMKQYMTLNLRDKPATISQLKTEMVIFFVDGSQIKKRSISPFIKPD
jgi:hypothetical protein